MVPRLFGLIYALFFKALKQERAFGHSNPYHRYAFDSNWLYQQTSGFDLCEIHYSYWARLNTACPKVVIVHDIWSDLMWGGTEKETAELSSADLLVTVSYDDTLKLLSRGLKNVHWSPPCIEAGEYEDSIDTAVVGSGNRHNVEGIDWLRRGLKKEFPLKIHCFGSIGSHIEADSRFVNHGRYDLASEPYRRCGVVLMLTTGGTGLQIKGVEALAAGRAIIARKGAMRGFPRDTVGWIEVDTTEEMEEKLLTLRRDFKLRAKMMGQARDYYMTHLHKRVVLENLKKEYLKILR